MTTPLFSSDLLARLRRPVLLSGVLFLSSFAGMCGDDDDDDGGTGPSADCIDEIDFDDPEVFFDENDVETITVGGNESGTISESDPEAEGYFYDFYAVAVDSDGDYSFSVNPSGDFDADLLLLQTSGSFIDYADDLEDPNATETIEASLDEGCYVIGVSSPIEGGTGSYSLSVEEL